MASQKLDELLPAARTRRGRSSRERVCEIGTSAGGTLYLLTRVAAPDAVIVSVDLDDARRTSRGLRGWPGAPGQRLVSLAGDSHTERDASIASERRSTGEPLDVLFIDGDHSLRGRQARLGAVLAARPRGRA